MDAATERASLVMNTPGGNAISVAEHTLALMLAMARSIPQASASTKAGKWEKKKFLGNELRGKTLGVIGLGNIGREVVKRARAFENEDHGLRSVRHARSAPPIRAWSWSSWTNSTRRATTSACMWRSRRETQRHAQRRKRSPR